MLYADHRDLPRSLVIDSGQMPRLKVASPYLALIPVCAGVFIAADDQTVIVTVLPQLVVDMEFQVPRELNKATWTVTGYLLGYTAAMPLMGRLSDVWGHRRLYVLSLLLFMLGSAFVALSPNLSWLVGARVFQAMGGGAVLPIAIAIVGDVLPSHRRGFALGLVGASAEAGAVIGPLWGGLFVRFLDWRWVFWVNLPLAAAVILLLMLFLGPSPRYRARVDYVGGLLIAGSLALLTVGLSRMGEPDAIMSACLVLSVVFFLLFLLRQNRVQTPLLPISMFRIGAFASANGTHLMVGGALIIAMVTIPLMTNTVVGGTALEGGLRLMRLTAAIPVGAILGGLAIQRWDYRIPTAAGLLLATAGFFLMSRWDADIGDPSMTLHLVLAGLGFGLVIAPIALAAINSVAVEDRGAAAAIVTVMRMVGMTIGLAALTAWGADRFQGLVGGIQLPLPLTGETPAQSEERLRAFSQGVADAGTTLFNEFFLVAMAVCLLALIPAAFMVWRDRDSH